ncbi:TetR family transcriptional regulator [Streptomyces sp. SCSIO 75703]|uniref:TetR/AcrR family transcriptional regulator n=1 Tax=unclassified Streptomyces TaxID=2593676 RepID=UPI0004C2420B|nr:MULTISPECIES: TetR family transcriptional regulator [unclassified Streptomyces]
MSRMAASERRERLVDAAIAVMVREGVSAATTRAIVAEADMPLGSFHYCFRSKEELLGEVIEVITGHTLERALPEVVGEGDLEDRLRRGMRAYWQHVVEVPDEHRLTYELTQYAARQSGLAGVAERQYQTYLAANTRLIEALTDKEGKRLEWDAPVPTLARYVTAVLDGVTLLYLNEGNAAAAGEVLDLVARHVAGMARHA